MHPQEQYQTLFERAFDGIFQTDLEGHYLKANAALAKMYGYDSPADLLAIQPLVRGKVYVEASRRQQILSYIQKYGHISNYEVQVYRKDGSTFWISESCWPVYDAQGKFAYFEGFIKDISASKAIEAALKRSELQSQAMIIAIPDLMFRVSCEGIYLGYVSTNRFTDLLPDEYQPIGQPLTKYLPADVVNRHLTHLQKALSTGEIQIYEQCHQLIDRQQYEEVRVVPIDDQEALFMIRDISSRKQVEMALIQKNQQLEEALQQLQQAQAGLVQAEKMVALGQLIAGIAHEINTPLGAIQAASGNAVNALEAALPKLPDLFTLLSPEQQQLVFSLIDQSLRSNQSLTAREKRQQRRALTTQLEGYGLTEARTVADTLIDMGIYENVQMFLPILQAKNSTFILDLAYDLARIKSNSKTIQLAVERAANVVKALKAYIHQDHTGKKVVMQVANSIETVLTLYHNQLKQGIDIQRRYEPVPEILCYPDELSQVWTNLIQNAIQAMNGKGELVVTIQLKTAPSSKGEGNYVVVSMTDTGPGIPSAVISRIFDPFFTTKPIGEGTGLGLDISQKIVSKHSGWIQVDSVPGCTCFEVWLPTEEYNYGH